MPGGHDVRRPMSTREQLAALACDSEGVSHETLSSGGAEQYEHLRVNKLRLGLQPGAAGRDLSRSRFGVKSSPAGRRDPFKMLDYIGSERLFSLNSGFGQGFVEQ